MAGGYSDFPQDPLEQLKQELTAVKARVAELERPTGSQLAETVKNIQAALDAATSALANQIGPVVATGSASSFTITTSPTVFVGVGITVPTGYTKALITANSTASEVPMTTIDRLYSQLIINGNAGAEVYGYTDQSIGGGVSDTHAVNLTGLTAGATISTQLQLRNLIGASGAGTGTRGKVTVTALFQK